VEEIDGYQDGSLRGYLAVLGRQKLIFVLAVLLVPAIAVGISMGQKRSYQASAQVLISDANSAANADRVAQTEVNVARVPIVASRALRAAGISGRSAADLLAHSSVTAKANANVLDFSVSDSDPTVARRLVNAYVRKFTAYRAELNAAPLVKAIADIRSKVAQLKAHGGNSHLIAALRSKESQLETTQQVQGSGVRVLRTAADASQASPRPTVYLILGLILGLVLGSCLAVLADALDKRVRSRAEVVEGLGLPLLGLIPCRSRYSGRQALAMLSDPHGSEADAVRMLKTKLVLANLPHGARIIMFASATADDGRLRVLANLAVSLARGHRRVVVVDLDLKEPRLPRVFGLIAPRGVTDVARGAASLEQALVHADLTPKASNRSSWGSARGAELRQDVVRATAEKLRAVSARWSPTDPAPPDADRAPGFEEDSRGELQVLATGSASSREAELLETEVVPKLLDNLRARSDVVLVNAPPLLRASDGIALGMMVDAIVVVASTRHTRRADLAELRSVLATLPPPKLGVVLTDANEKAGRNQGAGDLSRQATLEAAAVASARTSDVPASM